MLVWYSSSCRRSQNECAACALPQTPVQRATQRTVYVEDIRENLCTYLSRHINVVDDSNGSLLEVVREFTTLQDFRENVLVSDKRSAINKEGQGVTKV